MSFLTACRIWFRCGMRSTLQTQQNLPNPCSGQVPPFWRGWRSHPSSGSTVKSMQRQWILKSLNISIAYYKNVYNVDSKYPSHQFFLAFAGNTCTLWDFMFKDFKCSYLLSLARPSYCDKTKQPLVIIFPPKFLKPNVRLWNAAVRVRVRV